MPVTPVAPADAPRQSAPALPPPGLPPTSGGVDFASALAAASTAGATRAPASLPSVRLGEMMTAFASKASLGAPPTRGIDAGAPRQPFGVQAAAALGGPAPSGLGADVIAAGERYLGVPYKWGGTDPAVGLDCSGFVQRVFADLGVSLPRVSIDQSRAGTAVASMAQAQPGDLVFWNGDGSRPNHIGIYAGEGRMLVAPRTGDVVRYQDITREPHSIRRVR